MTQRRRRAAALVVAAAVGCSGSRVATDTIVAFTDAVQREDYDALFCLVAGAQDGESPESDSEQPRARFRRWARSQYEAYRSGRDRGWVELDGAGIRLVKLFALGRGTFQSIGRTRRIGTDALAVMSELRFGYAGVDLSRLSPGTTFYLSGAPPGRVEPLRVPRGSGEIEAEVLDTLLLEWTLTREPAGSVCGRRWSVASVVPVDGSARTTRIGWVF